MLPRICRIAFALANFGILSPADASCKIPKIAGEHRSQTARGEGAAVLTLRNDRIWGRGTRPGVPCGGGTKGEEWAHLAEQKRWSRGLRKKRGQRGKKQLWNAGPRHTVNGIAQEPRDAPRLLP